MKDEFEFDDLDIQLQPTSKRRLPLGSKPPRTRLAVMGDSDEQALYINWVALKSVIDHAQSSPEREIGGFLLGTEFNDVRGTCLDIKQAIEAQNTVERAASVTFTHASWDSFNLVHARQWAEYGVAGWYHSHPGFGVFLSEYDLFIHRNFFNEPFHVALVIDPINREIGLFTWQGKQIKAASGLAVYAPAKSQELFGIILGEWHLVTG
ncbi:MAG: Mov34/MPN/PAD-1 family protein [Candidatus Saccharibacteria bacterium]